MSIRQFFSPREILRLFREGERVTTESITVIVIPSRGATPRRFTVPRYLLYLVTSIAGFSLLCLVAFLLWSGRVMFDAHDAKTLRRDVARLTRENQRIVVLENSLRELEASQARILAWAGMPAPEREAVDAAAQPPEGAGSGEPMARPEADASEASASTRLAPVPDAKRAGWRWPVTGWFSHRYATGEDTPSPTDDIHPGVDIVAPRDTPVLAASDGKVTFAGWDADLGNMLTIEHDRGIVTVYGHNATLLVKTGDRVTSGQPIARVGSTGRSSAPHLHFEVRYAKQALDPEAFLAGAWKTN